MGLLLQFYDLRWALGLAAVVVWLGLKVRTYRRLSAFKGPFGTGFSELWHTRTILSMKSHLKYQEVCDKYGSVARVGPNDLVTSSLELLSHMSAVRSTYTRSAWYNSSTSFRPGKDHVFSMLDEEAHTRRRNQLAAGYSGKENLFLESSIDNRVAEFVNLIRAKYVSTDAESRPMDLAHKLSYLTLDVISDIGFGEAFGDLKTDSDVGDFIAAGETGLHVVTLTVALGVNHLLRYPLIARLLGPSEKDASGMGRLIANARRIIDDRLRRDMQKRSDMLASFSRHGLDPDELLTESTLQIIAGSDTTAAALRGIMLYLMSHPRVYSKLQAEVDAVARSAAPPPAVIPDVDTRKMQYLQAVVKEGIRIHPPVTDAVPKRVPDAGDTVTIDGKEVFLPGGTNISYAVWPLHMSKALFGEDADMFRPERWLLERDEKRLADMNRAHELMFGYGKYQCLGKPVALMEIGKAVFEMMRHFDWSLAKPDTPWKETNYMGIFTHSDMWVLATERGGQ